MFSNTYAHMCGGIEELRIGGFVFEGYCWSSVKKQDLKK
jgi:hypothetical protein